jgi:hypothetical protein
LVAGQGASSRCEASSKVQNIFFFLSNKLIIRGFQFSANVKVKSVLPNIVFLNCCY